MDTDSLFLIGWMFSIFCTAFCQDTSDGELVSLHVIFRHGSRIPSTMDTTQIPLWEQIGYNTIYHDGDLTKQGELQLETLGLWIRREYVENLGFLPNDYVKDFVSARSSAQASGRNLQSTQSLLRGLYPRASIPIYSTMELNRELIFVSSNCDSFHIEREARHREFDADVTEKFPELIENITRVVGFPPLLPRDLFMRTRDNLEQEFSHNIPSHPSLLQNNDIIWELADLAWEMVEVSAPDDPRGGNGPYFAYFLLDNIQESLRTDNGVRLYTYGAHGNGIVALLGSLGLPYRWALGADTYMMEVRKLADGRVFLNWKLVVFEPHNGLELVSTAQPLMCPNSSSICQLEAFSAFVEQRNPKGPGMGCCRIGEGFYNYGCDDYFNPVVNPECLNYRLHCPEVACGVNGVVDRATNLCVPRGNVHM